MCWDAVVVISRKTILNKDSNSSSMAIARLAEVLIAIDSKRLVTLCRPVGFLQNEDHDTIIIQCLLESKLISLLELGRSTEHNAARDPGLPQHRHAT